MSAALRVLVCAWVAHWAAAAEASSAPPAATTRAASVESTPIFRDGGPARGGAGKLAGGGAGFARTVMALGGVIGLIFGLRYAAKRWFGLPVPGAGGGPVKVLYRTPIGPRQQLMLIEVGRRVVLVSNTGTTMNTLAEITDPDELAEVVGEARARGREAAAASPFSALFGKAKGVFEKKLEARDEEEREEPNVEPVGPEAVNSLLEKVREMQKQFKRA